MFVIIGIAVVFGAVIGGYLMEHGNLLVLVQPGELVIIGMSTTGTVLIANPLHILKKIAARIAGAFESLIKTTADKRPILIIRPKTNTGGTMEERGKWPMPTL